MEGIIIMVIMIALSTLFNKGKQEQKKSPKQMPPFSSEPAPRKQQQPARPTMQQSKPRTLEDFANEIFGQLNEKAEQMPVPKPVELPKEKQARPKFVETVEETVTSKVEARAELTHRASRTLTERPLVKQLKQQESPLNVVPSNQRELMQAIVMSEILGPPKAKQK
jgi:hypothetical protein